MRYDPGNVSRDIAVVEDGVGSEAHVEESAGFETEVSGVENDGAEM